MDKAKPYFSIIILCWNSNRTIQACLEALNDQGFKDFEILLVDNGSEEPVSRNLVGNYPYLNIQFYGLEKNIGFAGGNNYAAWRARGEYMVLLNADAFPDPKWLENIRKGIEKYPHSFYASRLIMADHPERLDGAGDVYHISGMAWRKAFNTLVSPQKDREEEVFGACAAAAAYPSEGYRQVNGFDEDYFSYIEDVDLSFRLRLLGYRCIYLPAASVSHVGSGSTARRSNVAVYYGQRNLVWTYFKDMPGASVWLLAPLHLVANLLQVALAIFRKEGRITLKAKVDAFRGLPSILKKRKQVQNSRSVHIYPLMLMMDWNPFSPLIKLIHK